MATNYFDVKVLLDSVAPNGRRFTTFEATFPRFILAEFNTHRRFSRNAASSRAIPVATCMKYVGDEPVYPVEWGKNKPGMQADELLTEEHVRIAIEAWDKLRAASLECANTLNGINVHKQVANRTLELFRWITVIVSSTEWSNFFALRCDPNAQPEFQREAYMMRAEYLDFLDEVMDEPSPEFIKVAHMMEAAYEDSRPKYLNSGQWHIPMLRQEDYDQFSIHDLLKLSTARCARVSYLTHDGVRAPEKDFGLHDGLVANGHWSPFEHQARALSKNGGNIWSGNIRGFHQYRQGFPNQEL